MFQMVHLCLADASCKHLIKVIGDLNIIGNVPEIFLKKTRKTMEFCQSRKVGTMLESLELSSNAKA